eukprot:XP_002261008.1 hypothetical protein, conserved in Plasmodium species [Plasmodium knowlesi strain H]
MRFFQVVLLLVIPFTVSHLYNNGKLKCGKWDVRNYSEGGRWRILNGEDGRDALPSGNSRDARNDEHSVNEQISPTVRIKQVEFIDKETGESTLVDVEEGGRNNSRHATESESSLRGRNLTDISADEEKGKMLQEDGGGVGRTTSSSMMKKTVEGSNGTRDLIQHREEEEKEDDSKANIQGNAELELKSIPNGKMASIKDNESNLVRNIISQINYARSIGELIKMTDEGETQFSGRSILPKVEKERGNPSPDVIWGGNNPKEEIQKGNKNDEMIKGYANVLLNERKNTLKENVRNLLSRVFNLIVREKLMTRMCQRGEQQDREDKSKGEGCAKRKNCECSDGKKPTPSSSDNPRGDPTNCGLPKLSTNKFYQSEDLYNYYISLEEMLKSRMIRWKTDRVSKYFTFYPSKKIKDNLEDVTENKVFIESVRSILFDSHNKKEQNVYTSFAVVVETLFSLIKEEKVIVDMYSYVNLFFQDLDILNSKVLHFLINSSIENSNFLIPPDDLSLTNFEYILAKIYSRSVLANILSKKMNHSDSKKLSDFLISRNNDLKFTFLEKVEILDSAIPNEDGSSMVLRNSGDQASGPVQVDDDTLCKFIPIRKNRRRSNPGLPLPITREEGA